MGFIERFGLCLLVVLRSSHSEDICEFGSTITQCVLQNKEHSPILPYCASEKLHIVGPCCKSSDNSTILSIDLGFCNISSLVLYLQELQDVREMSIQNTSISCNEANFFGMKNLDHLWLSEKCKTCPGSWISANDTQCIKQSTCLANNEKCPSNALCENNGPGFYDCVCDSDHSGYRCLRNGTFPAWQFAAIIGSPTVVLSGVLWYFTLRKTISVRNA